jgi:hypothetical protein
VRGLTIRDVVDRLEALPPLGLQAVGLALQMTGGSGGLDNAQFMEAWPGIEPEIEAMEKQSARAKTVVEACINIRPQPSQKTPPGF